MALLVVYFVGDLVLEGLHTAKLYYIDPYMNQNESTASRGKQGPWLAK